MEDLLKLNDKDLLANERVIQIFIEMDKVHLYHHWDEQGNRRIPLSLGSLAFFMMDACVAKDIGDFVCLNTPTAKEIIIKAVLAWEGTQ